MEAPKGDRRPWMARLAMRDILITAIAMGAGVAIATSIFLIDTTNRLNRDAAVITDAVESVRVGKAMERLLSLHHRSEEVGARRSIEQELREVMAQAALVVASAREQAALEEVRKHVDAYLGAQALGRQALDRASASLVALVDINVAQASTVQRDIERRNHLANLLGAGAVCLVLVGTVVLILWLRGAAFRPIGRIHRAMSDYSAGDLAARAEVVGSREVGEIAAGFNRLADALAERRRSQLAFLAGVAHDLRSPLGAMTLAVENLKVRGDRDEPEARIVSLLSRQIRRLDRMLFDFVDASRIEAREFSLTFEHVEISALLREVAALFASTSARHRLELDLPPALEAECDPTRVTQIVGNLLANAIKYSPDGGAVTLSATQSGDEFCISVRDRGIGIPASERAGLFEPFRRLGRPGDIPGTGLGLFVVKRLVEAHRGRIEVESVEGAGSTFRVTLPCGRQPLGIWNQDRVTCSPADRREDV